MASGLDAPAPQTVGYLFICPGNNYVQNVDVIYFVQSCSTKKVSPENAKKMHLKMSSAEVDCCK